MKMKASLRSGALAILCLVSFACTDEAPREKSRPHFELETSGAELHHFLLKNPRFLEDADAALLKPVLAVGKRNLDWLVKINQGREASRKISLTSKETTRAYPIESPRESNTDIVLKAYRELQQKMPQAMADVIFGQADLPNDLPLTESDYIVWGNEVDHVYQAATRWLTMKPYLNELKEERKNDVRGYYSLSREPAVEATLENWSSLPLDAQVKYRDQLLGVCGNSEERPVCKSEFDSTQSKKNFWLKYKAASQTVYEDFFKIQWFRTDILWTSANPDEASMPFVDPNNAAIASYLKENVEDEWKWQDWQLRLNFQAGDPASMSHLEFKPGVTAHVETPNKIVMDENQPTTEYNSQWTIRHEYGHILGFPDCYIEFYDEDRGRMVNYQLDTTNLMCSRRGVLQQKHFDEMKRVYYRAH